MPILPHRVVGRDKWRLNYPKYWFYTSKLESLDASYLYLL